MRYYLIVSEYMDATTEGPFDTDEERDAKAREIHADPKFSEDGAIFWLDVEYDSPSVGSYTGAFFNDDEVDDDS